MSPDPRATSGNALLQLVLIVAVTVGVIGLFVSWLLSGKCPLTTFQLNVLAIIGAAAVLFLCVCTNIAFFVLPKTNITPEVKTSHNWARACHLAGLLGLVPIVPVVALLALCFFRRGDRFVEAQATEAANFQLSLLAWYIVGTFLIFGCCVLSGLGFLVVVLCILLWCYVIVPFGLIASLHKALYVTSFAYPFRIRFFKETDCHDLEGEFGDHRRIDRLLVLWDRSHETVKDGERRNWSVILTNLVLVAEAVYLLTRRFPISTVVEVLAVAGTVLSFLFYRCVEKVPGMREPGED